MAISAEKKRLEAIEVERKARQEEEQRRRVEREARDKLEQEARLKREFLLRNKQHKQRRKQQYTDMVLLLESLMQQSCLQRLQRLNEQKWLHFIECSTVPDPISLPDVNEFITTCKEERVQTGDSLKNFEVLETLNNLLIASNDRLLDAEADKINATKMTLLSEANSELKAFFDQQLEFFTFTALSSSKVNAHAKTKNYAENQACDVLRISLWGNNALTMKIKIQEFDNVTLDLPQLLQVNSVGVRLLFTKLDRISSAARDYDCHLEEIIRLEPRLTFISLNYELPLEQSDLESDLAESSEEEVEAPPPVQIPKIEEPAKSPTKTKTAKKGTKGTSVKNSKSKAPLAKPKALDSITTALKAEKAAETKEKKKKDLLKEVATMDFFTNMDHETKRKKKGKVDSLVVASPQRIAAQGQELKQPEKKRKPLSNFIVESEQQILLDGIYELRVFHLPPQPVTVNNWTLTEIVEPKLKVFAYPPQATESGTDTGSTPIGVSVRLPKDKLLLLEEPTVAFWDEVEKNWKKNVYTTHPEYDRENAVLRFRLHRQGYFAFFQAKHLEFPYHNWEMIPLGRAHIKFSLRGQNVKLFFEIKNDQIALIVPDGYEWRQLKHISLKKWISLAQMSQMLMAAGVSIFPTDYMAEAKNCSGKVEPVQSSVYRNLAWVSEHVAIGHSRWNTNIGKELVLFKCCFATELDTLAEDNWPVIMAAADNFRKLQITDKSGKFVDSAAAETQDHVSLPHLLCELKPTLFTTVDDVLASHNLNFVTTVHKWLLMTDVLSYCQ